MKLTKRMLLWAAAFLLAVVLGCLGGTAAEVPFGGAPPTVSAEDAGEDYAVPPGESFDYVDKSGKIWTVCNPSTEHTLIAHYYEADDRYAFGEYTIHSTDREWTYGEEGALNEEDWTSRLVGYTEAYNYHADYDANAKTEKNTPAGVYPNDARVTVSFAGDSDGRYRAFDESSFIIRASWGTVTIRPAILLITGGDREITYDGTPHSAAITGTTIDDSGVSIRYGTSPDACTAEDIAYTNAGTYTIYYRATAPNHQDVNGSLTMRIRPRDIGEAVITLEADKLMYNAIEQTVVIQGVEVDGLTLTAGKDYTVTSGDRGTDVTPGGYSLCITAAGNFTGTAVQSWEITRYTANRITEILAPGWTYNDESHPAHSATAIFGTPVLSYSDDGVNFGPLPENPHAGTWKVMASVPATDNYVGSKRIVSFVVEKDTWEGDLPVAEYDRPVYTGEAQIITPLFAGGPPDTVTDASLGATATLTHVGDSTTVTATLVYGNYRDLTVTWRAELLPAPVTIRTSDASKVYDGTPLAAEDYRLVSGAVYPGDDILGGAGTYASVTHIVVDNLNSGLGVVANTVTFPGNSDYDVTVETGTLTILPAPLSIRIDGESNDIRVYNGRQQAYLPTYIGKPVGFIGADLGAIDITNTHVQGKDVGEYPISGALVLFANNQDTGLDVSLCYDLVVEGEAMLIIRPLPITLTALDASVIYGDGVPAYASVAETLIEGESLGGIAYACDYTRGAPAGSYTIGFADEAAVRAANPNYEITFVTGTLTVARKVIRVPLLNATITYGDPAPDYAWDATGLLVGSDTLEGILFACDYDSTVAAQRAVGAYIVTASSPAEANPNYDITFMDAVLTVQKKSIALAVRDELAVYGDDSPAFGLLPPAEGLLAFEDTPDSLTVLYTCLYTPGGAIGDYAVSARCEDARYSITFSDGTLTVIPAALLNPDMTATFGALVYTGEAQSPLIESLHIGDDPIDRKDLRYTASEVNAGTYEVTVTVTGGNYEGSVGRVSFTIAPYPITAVEWIGESFVYTGDMQGPAAFAYGPLGERLTLSATGARIAGEHQAAAVDILPGEGYTVENYTLLKLEMDVGFFTITEAVPVRIRSAGVTLGATYGINFKVPVLVFEQYGIGPDEATVTMLTADGVAVTVRPETEVSVQNEGGGEEVAYYVFRYATISPQNLGCVIEVILSVGPHTDTRSYSVEEYCYSQLLWNGEDTRFATVLVALLRYGAAAQVYADPDTPAEELITHRLTADPVYAGFDAMITAKADGYADSNRGGVEPGTPVLGQAVGVRLHNGVTFTYYIDTAGVKVEDLVVTVNRKPYTDLIMAVDGRYYLSLPVSFVTCSEPLDIDVYINGTRVAFADFTLEGYAAEHSDTPAGALLDFSLILADYMAP